MAKNGKENLLKFYKDKLGQRRYTLASLREMIEDQFQMETAGRNDILAELDTREKRLQAVTEVAEYILASEYITLPLAEKRQVIEEVVANLFYFGALDSYLRDSGVTEISLDGIQSVGVRYGFGEIQSITSPFLDVPHLERTLMTVLAPAGAMLLESHPFLEVGVKLHERPVRLSIIAPPITPMYSVQFRLHPAQALTIADLIPTVIPEAAAILMQEALAAGSGLIVTGEVGVGKTTLIAALLNRKEDHQGVVVVERAAEMHLPKDVTHLTAMPPKMDDAGKDFEAQINEAIDHHQPKTLVLDEIRGDESLAFWRVLTMPEITQPIIAFRGTTHPARLLSALGMAIRKRQFALESETINQVLLEKLPYVAALHREKTDPAPYLSLFGKWIQTATGLSIQPLVQWDGKASL
jgi:type IV secretory pathway ATPase VirB11/archaellum biosynthesis ATPase